MNTNTYPNISLQNIECPVCKSKDKEHGGYRKRKLRTLGGIVETKVLKIRCRQCKKHLKSLYPQGTPRASWYSTKLHALMAILNVHHVKEACIKELSNLLNYPLEFKTRQTWQDSRVRRIEQQIKGYQELISQPEIISLDEFKLANSWAYTLTDVASNFVCSYAVTEYRNSYLIRNLIAELEPKAIISDGCKSIAAAMSWFPYIKLARCWFHVIKDITTKLDRASRKEMIADLQSLYKNDTLASANRWYRFLMDKYPQKTLSPLANAWPNLKTYWQVENMPLTNNTSEHLYSKLWARQKKRYLRTDRSKYNALTEAIWRHNHKPINQLTAFESFFNLKPSNHSLTWLKPIVPGGHTTFP